MVTSGCRCGENASLQRKFTAIEGHHSINIRDSELMWVGAVILPDIDGILIFHCNPHPAHIRCLTYDQQRQSIGGFQVTSVGIESDTKFYNWLFIFPQGIAEQSHFEHWIGVRHGRGWRRRLAQILQFEWADEVAPPAIFSR